MSSMPVKEFDLSEFKEKGWDIGDHYLNTASNKFVTKLLTRSGNKKSLLSKSGDHSEMRQKLLQKNSVEKVKMILELAKGNRVETDGLALGSKIKSQDGKYIYHISIIDYLQDYNVKKFCETYGKWAT